MTTNETITRLYFWCQHVIPLTYDNSLSYYEVLCKVVNKLKEVISELENQENEYYSYVDQKVEALKNYVDGQDTMLHNYIDEQVKLYYNDMIDAFQAYHDQLNKEMIDFQNKMVYQNHLNLSKMQLQYENFAEQIMKIINDHSYECFNPLTAKIEPTCKVINDIYDHIRYEAITAMEFDLLSLTAQEFDNVGITALDFDLSSNTILRKNPCNCYAYNPINGKIDKIDQIIQDLISYFDLGLTASEYDAKELTATRFDTSDLTAQKYDLEGSTITWAS